MQRNRTQQLQEDIDRILEGMGNTGQEGDEAEDQREPDTTIPYAAAQEEPGITVHVHEFTDAYVIPTQDRLIVIPKQEPFDEEADVIDTTLAGAPATQVLQPQGKEHRGSWLSYATISVVLLLSILSFMHFLLFPPSALIAHILKSQYLTATTTHQPTRNHSHLTMHPHSPIPHTTTT